MKEDEKEMWAMAYIGSMLVQALGNSIAKVDMGPTEMDMRARKMADRMLTTIAEQAPKKGK